MRRLFITTLISLMLLTPSLGVATQVYDESKSVTQNVADALIAMANATGQEVSLINVLFVDGNRTDSYTPNGSMAAPYKTITAANAAAVSGDVLVVAPGAYAETVSITAGAMLFGWNVTGATLTGEYFLHSGSAVTFTGDLTMENGETVDNTVDGTVAITAPITTFSGAIDVQGGDVTLENDETIGNSVDGTVDVSGALDVQGGVITLENDETIDNSVDGTVAFDGSVDITAAGGLTLSNDETITNGTDGQLDLNGDVYLNGATKYKAACTIAADDVTPSVAGCAFMITSANTGATAITDLDDPVVGSVVWLIGGSATNSSTIADSGNFNLSAAWTAGLDDMLCIYVQADNDYIECGRVNN